MTFLKQKLLLVSLVSICLLAMTMDSKAADDDFDSSSMGSMSDSEGDTDEGFCRLMCPPGNGACTYEDCMSTGVAPKKPGATPAAPPSANPAQPVCTTGPQSSCCLLDKSCKPGCPITRNLCIKK